MKPHCHNIFGIEQMNDCFSMKYVLTEIALS